MVGRVRDRNSQHRCSNASVVVPARACGREGRTYQLRIGEELEGPRCGSDSGPIAMPVK